MQDVISALTSRLMCWTHKEMINASDRDSDRRFSRIDEPLNAEWTGAVAMVLWLCLISSRRSDIVMTSVEWRMGAFSAVPRSRRFLSVGDLCKTSPLEWALEVPTQRQ